MTVDAEAIATAVAACPSVARLSGGAVVQVATYLPGRRVLGVRVIDDAVEVNVVANAGVELPTVGREVIAAVAPLAQGRSVHVSIDDIDTSGPAAAGPSAASGHAGDVIVLEQSAHQVGVVTGSASSPSRT